MIKESIYIFKEEKTKNIKSIKAYDLETAMEILKKDLILNNKKNNYMYLTKTN